MIAGGEALPLAQLSAVGAPSDVCVGLLVWERQSSGLLSGRSYGAISGRTGPDALVLLLILPLKAPSCESNIFRVLRFQKLSSLCRVLSVLEGGWSFQGTKAISGPVRQTPSLVPYYGICHLLWSMGQCFGSLYKPRDWDSRAAWQLFQNNAS